MTKLIMTKKDGKDTIAYQLKDVKSVVSCKARELYSKADLQGNNIKPGDVLTQITLFEKDGGDYLTATFDTKNYIMTFE